MAKIVVNNEVIDRYRSGMSLNDSIRETFKDEFANRIKENAKLETLSPLNMAMRDAGLSKYSSVGDMMNLVQTSGGVESNEWLFPAFVESTVHEAIYGDNIIPYLCNTTIGVDSNIVKSASLDLLNGTNKDAIRKKRVSEGADLPVAKIKIGEKAISLWKHGRAIEMTYEAARRMRIDLFAKHLRAITADIAHQNVEDAVDVLINGDGNKNGSVELANLHTSGGLTAQNLIGVMIDYWDKNHFTADTMTMGKKYFKQLVGMTFDPSLAAGASMKLTFNIPQIGAQNVTLLCADVPQIGSKDVILLSSKDNSLIRYEENGSNIQENQSFARNQTRLLTVSENSGYAIGVTGSNMHIVVSA